MEKKKNGIIELLRFLFAFNVVKNHGFFPYQGSLFTPGRISVEFFFVLSGYLFALSLYKYKNGLLRDLFNLYKGKLLKLGVPLLVGLVFNIFYKIASDSDGIGIWGYLWYVHDMLFVFAVFLVLRKLLKDDSVFWLVIFIIAIITSFIHANELFYKWGYFRAFPAIAIGMLVTKLPKLDVGRPILWVAFSIISVAILKIFLFEFNALEEALLNLILYPALIYISFQIECENKFFNYLGSLSFGLYAFQSIPRYMREIHVGNVWIYFAIIVACAITEDLIKRIIKFKNAKKAKELKIT